MLLGAHVSVAGGLPRAVNRAVEAGMTAFQIFVRPPRNWKAPSLANEDVRRFRSAVASAGIRAVVAHAIYLSNPASPDRAHRLRSERVLVDEVVRCERLGIRWLVLHPGSHRGTSARAGVRRAAGVLRRVLDATRGCQAGLCLENTAGQGDGLGREPTEIEALLAAAGDDPRLAVCLDTAHAFAGGVDLATEDGYRAFRREIGGTVGLRRVRVVHVNDSRTPCGSRVDRHAGIGLGRIGLEAFRRLVRDPSLGRRPLILETPKGTLDGEDLDLRNLRFLRALV